MVDGYSNSIPIILSKVTAGFFLSLDATQRYLLLSRRKGEQTHKKRCDHLEIALLLAHIIISFFRVEDDYTPTEYSSSSSSEINKTFRVR